MINEREKVRGYFSNSNNSKQVNQSSGNDMPTKVLRYTHDTFTKELMGKTIEILLTNNTTLKGKLVEMGVYDIAIEITKDKEMIVSDQKMFKPVLSRLIILKSAIMTVEVIS